MIFKKMPKIPVRQWEKLMDSAVGYSDFVDFFEEGTKMKLFSEI